MTDLNNPLRTAEYPTLRATVTTATTAVNTNPFPAGCQGFMVVMLGSTQQHTSRCGLLSNSKSKDISDASSFTSFST
jgi:hypothetical protein